jgi:dienelactone hydrolase
VGVELKNLFVALLILLAGCASQPPVIQKTATDDGIERLTIPSVTPLGVLSITQHIASALKPVQVSAELHLPGDSAGQPMPAILLAHSSGGLTGDRDRMAAWVKLLNSWGVAALVVDSFGSRHIVEVYSDHSQTSDWANVADAFAGLRALASDPRFDRDRIGIMGFSYGGSVAARTALETVRKSLITDDAHFAVHIPFFPGCDSMITDRATDKKPMLFLHGEADDMNLIAACREYAHWFESMGHSVDFVSYPGASHGFDRPVGEVVLVKNEQVAINCDGVFDVSRGRFVRLEHKERANISDAEVKAYYRSCRSLGGHAGRNEPARQDSINQVHAFLMNNLGAR